MSAANEYCDREIAKCKDMIRSWPHEAPCLKRLIKGWQRTKQQLQQPIEYDVRKKNENSKVA
ncbi:hypothetical protein [Shewanella sp. MEBiC00475]|uniref:hypothetical protein n=1 Tax=Shewanella sp. MEBiC00475 TaxID=2575361 RepID=UPI0010C00D05|nr:hypothetical protein [Shewanella sp. MEBiC00475]